MNFKERFNELGYKLLKNYMVGIDLVVNGNFVIRIDYDKKKIVVHDKDINNLCEISNELLKILFDYLTERNFFEEKQ